MYPLLGVGVNREKTGIDLLEHISGGVRLEPAESMPAERPPVRDVPEESVVAGLVVSSDTRVIVIRDDD